MHLERTVMVSRPAEVVFDFLASGPRCTRWRQGIREIARMTSSTGVGAVYRQVLIGPGGHDIDGDFVVTDFERPHRLGFAIVAGPARPTGSFLLTERDAQHTEVRFSLDAEAHGIQRVLFPLWARQMRHEISQLDQLKNVLENA